MLTPLALVRPAVQPVAHQTSCSKQSTMPVELPNFSDYIVFVDESGSPTLKPIDPDYPIFVLVFCVVQKLAYADKIQPLMKKLKFDFFGHDMVALHAHEIRKPKGEFSFLIDAALRQRFTARIDEIVGACEIDLIVHIIDKKRLTAKYANPFDPYHIALRMCLEQLSSFLRERDQGGRLTHVIAESRGRAEDRRLEAEFRRILDPNCNWGMADRFRVQDTPFDLRFVEKKINSAGLQLADLMGQPIGRNYLKPDQPNHAFEIIRTKVFRSIWQFP